MSKVAETAKLIRAELKKAFPGVKFSVRSKSYSGGSSINVDWVDFPTRDVVDAVVRKFANVRYDEYTGEILSGGNSFVFCQNEWSEEVREQIATLVPDCINKNDFNYYHFFNKAAEELQRRINGKPAVVEIVEEIAPVEVIAEVVEVEEVTAPVENAVFEELTAEIEKTRQQATWAEKQAQLACKRRAELGIGATRAKVTTANARWASAAEHRDHLQRKLAELENMLQVITELKEVSA